MLSDLGEWQAGKWWSAGASLQVPAAVLASVLIVFFLSCSFAWRKEAKRIQPCVIKVIFPESIWLSQEFSTLTRKCWSWSWQAPRTGNIKSKSFWAFVHGDAVGTDGRKGRVSQAEDPLIPAGRNPSGDVGRLPFSSSWTTQNPGRALPVSSRQDLWAYQVHPICFYFPGCRCKYVSSLPATLSWISVICKEKSCLLILLVSL